LPFAFNPDDGPARIIRFVDTDTENLLAVYDKSANLLIIAADHYERLSWLQKHQLLRTHDPITTIHSLGDGDVLLAA
jgi:hypothetical protein